MDSTPYIFNIDVVMDIYPYYSEMIAASEYKGYTFPDGELPSSDKHIKWSDQTIADYDSFLESVEDYLVDTYDLEVYYRNYSEEHSMYFGMLAKDNNGNILFKFNLRLRISNHSAHRSQASQRYKKEEKHELAKITKNKKLQPIVRYVVVNNTEFRSYLDAIIYIDDVIDEVMMKMQR